MAVFEILHFFNLELMHAVDVLLCLLTHLHQLHMAHFLGSPQVFLQCLVHLLHLEGKLVFCLGNRNFNLPFHNCFGALVVIKIFLHRLYVIN